MRNPKEFLSDVDLKAMPRKQLIRLFREEQSKADELEKANQKFLYWLKNSAEFTTAPAFSKNGDF